MLTAGGVHRHIYTQQRWLGFIHIPIAPLKNGTCGNVPYKIWRKGNFTFDVL